MNKNINQSNKTYDLFEEEEISKITNKDLSEDNKAIDNNIFFFEYNKNYNLNKEYELYTHIKT